MRVLERERDREGERERFACVCVYACVCEREKESVCVFKREVITIRCGNSSEKTFTSNTTVRTEPFHVHKHAARVLPLISLTGGSELTVSRSVKTERIQLAFSQTPRWSDLRA